MTKPILVTDETILEPARKYVRDCLEIMRQELTPEKFEEVVQTVAQYPARIRANQPKKTP